MTTDAPEPQPAQPDARPPQGAPPALPSKKKSRLWRVTKWTASIVVVLVVLVAVAVPVFVASVGRGKVVSALNERINGTAELGSLSFSWTGALRATDLTIKDASGDVVIAARSLAATFAPLKAIAGAYALDVKLDEPLILAKQDAQGRCGLATLFKPAPPEPPRPPEPSTRESKLPDVVATLAITNGHVTHVDAHGKRTAFDLTTTIRIDSLDKPIDLELNVAGASTAALRGTLTIARNGKFDLGNLTADLTLDARADLAHVGGLLGFGDTGVHGKANASFRVKGDAGKLKVAGTSTVENLVVDSPGQKAPVTEPKLVFTTDADIDTGRLDIVINTAKLESSFIRGALTGRVLNARTEPEFVALRGDFAYVPDKLGAVIKPWITGRLTGAGEEKVSFSLDGRAKETDILAILRGAAGTASVGLGRYVERRLDVKGLATVDLKAQQAALESSLDLNNGRAAVAATIDLRDLATASSTIKIALKNVDANADIAPLLAELVPLFALADATTGFIGGKIDCDLDLTFQSPLRREHLAGIEALKKPIHGHGHFEIRDVSIAGSPLLTEMVAVLQLASIEGMQVHPVDFVIHEGRVRRDKPAEVSLGGHKTYLAGGLTATGELDCVWEIPVTEKMLGSSPFLKPWQNERLKVPIKGTPRSPRIGWRELLADLAKRTPTVVDKGLDVIEDLLGGKAEKEAQKLLGDADRLHAEGRTADAAPLYKQIYDKYHDTRVYRGSKERIKQRMTGP